MKILSLYILKEIEKSKSGLKMIRTLKPDTYYNFYKDIRIEEDVIVVSHSKCPQLYSSEKNKNVNLNKLEINICAIVGENGSGKSSIIDMIIRIINNLVTYTLGESIASERNEHLHYIENVYAKLFVLVDSRILGIKCCNSKIFVEDYKFKERDGNRETYVLEKGKNGSLTMEGCVDFDDICKSHKEWEQVLRNFCFTIINNYSLHGFNLWTYVDEFTTKKKEKLIIEEKTGKKPLKIDDETDCCWLKGLMRMSHDNRIPLIITPIRVWGCIDINNLNQLSAERFASLLLMEQKKSVNGVSFKEINKKYEIHAIKISKEKNISNRRFVGPKYENKSLLDFLIRETIQTFTLQDIQKDYKDEIYKYIGFEILNILYIYNNDGVRKILNNSKGELTPKEKKILKNGIDLIWSDHSYITINLMRCINYMRYDHIGKQRKLFIEQFREIIENIIDKENRKYITLQCYPPQNILELLPPPIFSIDFLMYEKSDKKKVHAIPFSTLSSGEKQMTFILSSLFYYLYNIDSEWYGKKDKDINNPSLKYKHVNIVFDEVELYFHPEMQRNFIHNLLYGLKQLSFDNIKSIQILMVTHSPFVLSDIPNDQVLFLQKNGQPDTSNMMSTFGANFHTMLRNSFFLKEGTIGKFAQETIKDAIKRINFYDLYLNSRSLSKAERKFLFNCNSSLLNDLPEDWRNKLITGIEKDEADNILNEDFIRQLLGIIQEPVIRTRISEVLEKLDGRRYVDFKTRQ